MAEKKKTIEEMLDEVDSITEKLENGDIALEDSFKIYEKGMKLLQAINSKIDKVEKQIMEIEAGVFSEDENRL